MAEATDRLSKLMGMLEREPDDTFLLYAVALEQKKAGRLPEALVYLDKVLEKDPGYCVAHHQAGLIHEEAGDVEAARRSYRTGIEVAGKKGDSHAKSEMEAALMMIE